MSIKPTKIYREGYSLDKHLELKTSYKHMKCPSTYPVPTWMSKTWT